MTPRPPSEGRTTAEVSDALGVSQRLVQRWIAEGVLPARVIGDGKARRYRVSPADFKRVQLERDSSVGLHDVAETLGVTYRHARRLVATGELRATNVSAPGKRAAWRVSKRQLAACVKRRAPRRPDRQAA